MNRIKNIYINTKDNFITRQKILLLLKKKIQNQKSFILKAIKLIKN